MARRISREEGIFVGYSAGSVIQGLLQLKDQLKKSDVVVVIFCDHGSRYVAKVYNDQWMMERGFLEVKTLKDLVNARATKRLVTVLPAQTVADAIDLMKKYDIENVPVMNGEGIVGSLSESGLFNKIISNPEIKSQQIRSVMEDPYPIVAFDTSVGRLSKLISKENGAVLSKDESGNYHIITKYDIIQSLAK
jgi:cystathionine beta-synthase